MIDESMAREICLLIANYLLLSTLLIALVAGVCKFGRIKSFALRDHLWKFAIVAPFLLVGIQSILQPPGTTWSVATYFEETAETAIIRPLEPITFRKSFPQGVASEAFAVMEQEVAPAEIPDLPLIPFETNAEEAVIAVEEPDDVSGFVEQVFPLASTDSFDVPNEFDPGIAFSSLVTNSVLQLQETIIPEEAESQEEQRPAAIGIAASKPPETKSFTLLTPFFVVCCFAFAVAFGVLRSMILSCYVSITLRRCQVINSGPLWDMTRRLQQQMSCKQKVTLLERSGSHEPAACGIWHWRILVPENLLQRLSTEEVEALIAHELAHLQRRDPLWGWMFQLVKNCFFWQPWNFLAVKQWRIAAEHCCDSQAVNAGIDRLTLARCLTSIASWKLTPQPAIGVGVSTTTLGLRVETLVDDSAHQDHWNNGWRRHVRWLFGVCLMASMVLFVPRMSWTSEPESEVAAKVLDNAGFKTDDEQFPLFAEPISPTHQQALPENILSQSNAFNTLQDLSIESEIVQVTTDLNYALTLLKNQEDDPEIVAVISSLQRRIVQLKERVEKNNELAEASVNKPPRDQKESAHEFTSQSIGGTE